uniref:RING-type domain-containing protein n=1 Tax=Mesocestoides corti TaxID=53468 RepID=A0A5K3ENN1_MESCO
MFSRSDCWMSTPERRSAARGGRTVGSECAHTAIREFCAGITSRPDSGFSDQNTPLSDTMAFSNVVRDPADTSLVDSMFQSSPAGFRPPIARSSNQESPKPWCPLFRLIEPQPMALRGATPIRTFRPRSAPLAVEGFSLPEEDEEEEEEEESRSGSDERPPEVAGAELPQTSTGHRDASPPPPAVFIPRDQRQARGCVQYESGFVVAGSNSKGSRKTCSPSRRVRLALHVRISPTAFELHRNSDQANCPVYCFWFRPSG